MPLVSWVWKCSGRPTSSFSALTSALAARGLHTPAMSLMPMMWAPAFSSCFASPT